MESATRRLWAQQNRHDGDRRRLFTAVRAHAGGEKALYPGSFVDVALSAVYPAVTYVDMDKRARRFFADTEGVAEIIASMGGRRGASVDFVHADYRGALNLEHGVFDLLVSLYAGFVSGCCARYLRTGGALLVGPSHGDAAMASIDPGYALSGVVLSRGGAYRVSTDDLGDYLIPKKPVELTAEALRERGRGVAYTKSPFAYLFTKVEGSAPLL